MRIQTLSDLMIELLRTLFDAEKQLVRSLPRLARAASSPKLREAFETHMEEAKLHAERLGAALELLDQPVRAKKCRLMQEMLDECKDVLDVDAPPDVLDAALAALARRVGHIKIAGYSSLCLWAGRLDEAGVQKVLAETLDEERRAAALLEDVAEGLGEPSSAEQSRRA